nr:hypothetical protein [Candidatus Enterousia merdequi]
MKKIKTNKKALFLTLMSCLCLLGCYKQQPHKTQKTESGIKNIKNTIDSLQNLDSIYNAQTILYSSELQSFKKKHPYYNDVQFVFDNLNSLQNHLFDVSILLRQDIKNMAKPFCNNNNIIRNLLKRNEVCKSVFEQKENKISTEDYIAVLKEHESQIQDKQNYKRLLCTYRETAKAIDLIDSLFFELDSYYYTRDITNNISFQEDINTNPVVHQSSYMLRNLKRKHLSEDIDKDINQIQSIIKTIIDIKAIEDSLFTYQTKQQDIQTQIAYQQQLLKQKTK